MSVLEIKSVPTFRDLQGRFARAEKTLLEARRDLMRSLGRRFVGIAQGNAPHKIGNFAKGIRFRTYNTGNEIGFTVSTPQPLGKWIIEGTKPHIINAKGSEMLRFYWAKGPRGAGIYYFRSVNHPGTQPNDFIDRSYDEWKPEAMAGLKRISTKYIAVVNGRQR